VVAAARLDHVRVQRALHQVVDVFELQRLFLEHPDELGADDLALGLGVGDAGQLLEEALLGVDRDQRNPEVLEGLDHFVPFVRAHQAVVDEDAGQPVADRLVDQLGRDRRVDPTAQTENDFFVFDGIFDLSD